MDSFHVTIVRNYLSGALMQKNMLKYILMDFPLTATIVKKHSGHDIVWENMLWSMQHEFTNKL